MDVQLPRLDGLEATRRIRLEIPEAVALPIVAMTANAMTEDRKRCLDAGMDDYLSKPIEPKTLLATVERRIRLTAEDSAAPEPPSAPESEIVVDEPYLDDLQRVIPPPRFAALIQAYIDGAARALERLAALSESGDVAGVRREAHDLVGTAGNLGAKRLQALGMRLRAACAADDRAQMMHLVHEIRQASPEASSRLRSRLLALMDEPQLMSGQAT